MSAAASPRPRKRKQQKEAIMKEQIVAQVHKTTTSSVVSATSSENDYANNSEDMDIESSNNKTYTKFQEDKNVNINTTTTMHTPSREISVDGETQINSKILSLIETEMKRDINKHSHFTDSRPQSLSFYEDEKVPEELSGNLELLSPEERKHYKKRKEYLQMDTEEMNAYNTLQDSYINREGDDIMSSSLKKSKSRKKRHVESELGMGDSREMMIPKEKKKSKKKRRDCSPVASSNSKRKHKRREEEELRNDITVALEELQDDVFENGIDESITKPERMKKSPRRSDKLYVQKKNKFEVTQKPNVHLTIPAAGPDESGEARFTKRSSTYPLEVAIIFQRWWMRLSTLCHGLLGGLALGHLLYIVCNYHQQDFNFLLHYAYYSDIYVGVFFALCVLCIVSVFDRIDFAHLDKNFLQELWRQKRSSLVVILYVACLIIHLANANYDDKLSLMTYKNDTITSITQKELTTWNHLSFWRAILAFTAWIFVGLGPPDDMLFYHLKSMEMYLPNK